MKKETLRIGLTLALFSAVVIVLSRLANAQVLLEILTQINLVFVVVALLAMVMWLFFNAATIESLLRVIKHKLPFGKLTITYLAAQFAGVVLPSIGLASILVFVKELKQRDFNSSHGLAIGFLFYLTGYVTFSVLLIVALAILSARQDLSIYQALTAVVMFFIVGLGILVFIVIARSRKDTAATLTLVFSLVNVLSRLVRRRPLVTQEKLYQLSGGLHETIEHFVDQPKRLAGPSAWAFLSHLAMMMVLGFLFLAAAEPIPVDILATGYAIGWLFSVVSITPQGVGFVEAAMIGTFTSLGVAFELATVVVLAYRGITFWLPFMFALGTLHRLDIMAGLNGD